MKKGILVLALFTWLFGSPGVNAQKKSTLKGEISLSGAFALYPMAVKWAEEIKKIHPDVRISACLVGSEMCIRDRCRKGDDGRFI